MILADTSIWVGHLRGGDATLVRLLEAGQVLTHPFVIGELALGVLRQRDAILHALADLPPAAIASDDDVLGFVAANALSGVGIGWVDAHLLAATRLTPEGRLWTRDKALGKAAARLGLDAGMTR